MAARFIVALTAIAVLASSAGAAPQKKRAPKHPVARGNMCMQDYCPCDSPGGISKILCRNLRAGVRVSPQQMAAGAAQRDAQLELQNSPFH